MMKLELLCHEMEQLLLEWKIPVRTEFRNEEKKRYRRPLVLLSLKEIKTSKVGFQNYLGERFSTEEKSWEEVYGQGDLLRLGLDIYSPREGGEELGQAVIDSLALTLTKETLCGLSLCGLSWKEAFYDPNSDMLKRSGEAKYEGMLYTVEGAEDSFLTFEVKGGMTFELCDDSV